MSWRVKRNRILFWGGLSGFAAMFLLWAIAGRTPDPQFMLAFTAMVGITVPLRADEEHKP